MIHTRKTGMGVNAWWGYVHENDSLHVKRYYGLQDIVEAKASPFCKRIHGPFPAKNSEVATEMLKQHDLVWHFKVETGISNNELAWKLMVKSDFDLIKALELLNQTK